MLCALLDMARPSQGAGAKPQTWLGGRMPAHAGSGKDEREWRSATAATPPTRHEHKLAGRNESAAPGLHLPQDGGTLR